MKLATLVVLAFAAACGSASDGPTAAPSISWPVVYDLASLISPYAPGSEYTTPTTCGRVLRSSLVSGTLTLNQDNTAEVYLKAWDEEPSSFNAPGIPCPSFITLDLSGTKKGNYSISGAGSSRQITIAIGGVSFGVGVLGTTGFPSDLEMAVTGYTLYGKSVPFTPLQQSGWRKR